ncbi:MAG TPA: TonB C-terminal domain-containing protein [Candidatus Hydrogenedentes bacterium]|nr:TonB C-terminal domain-containing protein [Candidatus Hydrogenedentota bacterium]HQH51385.1 TonB C-terminal domain-containing protein [Candidatus Hydrogenedentota bacterium]
MSLREPDNYARRMTRATVAAAFIHAVLIVLFSLTGALDSVDAIGPVALSDAPLVLNLEPEPERIRNFVDTAIPTDSEVDPTTDLISDKPSKASGLHDSEGERPGPQLEHISDIDDLAGPMTAAPAAPPQPSSEAVLDEPQPETQEPAKSGETSGDQEQLEALTTLARVDETMPSFDKAPPEQAPEQMAQAQPQPEIVPAAPPQPHVGISKSRPDGAAEGKGFVGFEAMEHELGPYLKEVRDRVERNWRAALEMRFSGVARTKAVLECAINSQGKLVYVKIVESGDSPTFAMLCKQSIEKAAPFPRFPFDVPAIYRTQNLEIRWTFSYL